MSYGECSVVCWRKLVTSIFTFYQRTVSEFLYNVKNCWKETYRHCTEHCHCWFCWCRVKGIFCILWQTIVNIVCTVVQVYVVIVELLHAPRDVLGTCSGHLKNPDGRSGRARAELGSSLRKLGLPTCGAASPTIRQRGFTNSCMALAITREGSRCRVSAFAVPDAVA